MNTFKKYLFLSLTTAASTATYADSILLEEIIVTAQKREQNINDVALTVTAFQGDTIRALGVEDIRDLTFLLPNIDIKGAGISDANPAITVRGVGLNNFNANNNPAVGIYSDEIFLTSPAMINLALLDIDRVEILKGPQGTLYGRNSTGGALNITTAKPTQEADGFVSATVGTYQTTKVEAAYGAGLSDSIAGRVSFLYDSQGESFHDYFIDNGFEGETENFGDSTNTAFRGQLAGEHDQLNWNLSVGILSQDIVNSPFTFISGFWEPGLAFVTPCADVGNPLCETTIGLNGAQEDDDPYTHQYSSERADSTQIESDVTNINFNLAYDFNGVTLTSITGMLQMDRNFGEDIWSLAGAVETFNVIHDEEIEQLSQEFRLNGESDSMHWIAGLFYSNDTFVSENIANTTDLVGILAGLDPVDWNNDQETTAMAAFASFDWLLSEKISLTTGVRYSNEETDFIGGTNGLIVDPEAFEGFAEAPGLLTEFGLGVGDTLPLTEVDNSFDDNNLSWRLALEYNPQDAHLYYASVSTGFKSGGFFGDFTFDNGELGAFDSETIMAYELGTKLTLMEGKSQFNAAVFLYDYENIQTFLPADFGFKLDNLEGADILGVDLEFIINPVDGLDIRLAAGYLDTEVTSSDEAFNGNELPNAAKFQLSGLARYEHHISNSFNLAFQFDFKQTDDAFRESTNSAALISEGYITFNARVALLPINGNWEVAAWGKNITNEEYYQERFASDIVGAIVGLAGNPATFGLTYNYDF